MYLLCYKTIISIVAFGCLMPALALTEVVKTDGSVVRGEIVSNGNETIVMNVDGSNISIARSMIKEVRSDESQSSQSVSSSGTQTEPTYNSGNDHTSPSSSNTAAGTHFGRTEPEHVTIGADVNWSFLGKVRSYSGSDATGDTARNSLTINPYVGIHPSEIFEIRPSLFFSETRTSYDYESNTSGSNSYSSKYYSSQVGLGAGVGFLFHVIHGNFFRFVLGPQIGYDMYFAPASERQSGNLDPVKTEYDKYVDIDIPITVPFSLDFVVSNHLGFRLSSTLLSFGLSINSVELKGQSNSGYTDVSFTSSLDLMKTITQFGIGAFLLF